ncbi:MAG: penicillin-binding protein 2 [Eubacteriales bacterium]|nr:penicillin-binding protein 2 [Eubacteriales bacterium]
MDWSSLKNRYTVVFIIIAIMIIAIFVRLFRLQVIMGEYYSIQSENRLIRSQPIPAPRGEILDRYGRPLITNRQGFNIVFRKEYIKDGMLNQLILDTINVMEFYGEVYIDTFPITYDMPFEFYFPDVSEEKLDERITQFKKNKKIDKEADANGVIDFYTEKYKIDRERFTPEQIRKIIGVRYEMEARLFGKNTPYTFATDVGIDCVTYLKERSSEFPGVTISVEPIREYTNGTLAAHILGFVGVMYAEEYEVLKDKNYNINDLVGKDGIEKYLEGYLKGKDGSLSIEQNIEGKMTKVIESKPEIPGNYAVLTLDAQLQKTLEDSLERTIGEISRKPKTKDARAGAGVVIDVGTGEILAMASYPTFDPSKFNELWGELSQHPDKPMWNRAISGLYAPGSTFKVLTAIAALELGVISPNESIYCEGIYNFYASSGYAPRCWVYPSRHGHQNAVQAIENSCNYYFYEVGRRMGIDSLAGFGGQFGLGEVTGVELYGESKGILASREYREKIGQPWYPGDTVQAAIGQSDHLFTPVQLANYTATIANGGRRYRPHLVKSVKAYDTAQSIFETPIEVLNDINIKPQNYQAVIRGMRRVSETGTASTAFASFEIPVGGKTGSASVASGEANGLFIAFAPFDDPQIAVAVVIEHAGSGGAVIPVAKDVIEAYMAVDTVEDEIEPYNRLVR